MESVTKGCDNCGTCTDLAEGENVKLCPLCIIAFYSEIKTWGCDLDD